jgi:hypothetical protein
MVSSDSPNPTDSSGSGPLDRAIVLDELTRLGASSADDEVVKIVFEATPATMVQAAVRAALDALESNGMIAFTMTDKPYEYRVQMRGGPQPKRD